MANVLLDLAGQFLAVVGHRLGPPSSLPSTLLVTDAPAGPRHHGYVTVHPCVGGSPALYLAANATDLAVTIGRLGDGRPFVEVHADDLDPADRDADGQPYLQVGLDGAVVYDHQQGQPPPGVLTALVLNLKHGTTVSLHPTPAAAWAALAAWVRKFWPKELGDVPDDDQEAIVRFFDTCQHDGYAVTTATQAD
jgi:hypothetical protein